MMSQLDETLKALLDLSRADDATGIMPVNLLVDGFARHVGGSVDDRLIALNSLREAFERRSPDTDLARYALGVIDHRRYVLQIDWWQAYRRQDPDYERRQPIPASLSGSVKDADRR